MPKPKMKPLDDFHKECLMTIEEFKSSVECGGFIDYDGWGNWATATEVSSINVSPSEFESSGYKHPSWATHICWYNK